MIAAVYILLGALLWSVISHVAAGYRAERKRLRILEAMGDNFARALAESVASRQPQSGAAEASRPAGDAASGCADSDVYDTFEDWVYTAGGMVPGTAGDGLEANRG